MNRVKLWNFIGRIFMPKKFRQKFLTKSFQKAPIVDCGLWAKVKAEKAAKTATAQASSAKDRDLFREFVATRGTDVDPDVMTVSSGEKVLHNQLKKSRELGDEINIVDLLG